MHIVVYHCYIHLLIEILMLLLMKKLEFHIYYTTFRLDFTGSIISRRGKHRHA